MKQADKFEAAAMSLLFGVVFAMLFFALGVGEVVGEGRVLFFPGFEWVMLGMAFAALLVSIILASYNVRLPAGKPAKFWYLLFGLVLGALIIASLVGLSMIIACSTQVCENEWAGGGMGGNFVSSVNLFFSR